MLPQEEEEQSRTLSYAAYHYNSNLTDTYYLDESMEEVNNHRRLAQKSGWLVFLQVVLCTVGVIIAILVHLFKLLMRVIGEGCCTCCITSVEYTWTVSTVIITILIVPVAIATAIILIIAASVGFKKKVLDKRREEEKANAAVAATAPVERPKEQTDVEKKNEANAHVEKKDEDNACDAVDEEIGLKNQ